MEKYDILINNAKIVDGSGSTCINGSIAIKDEKIHSIGEVQGISEINIDAKGLVVSPGWIDVHNHGDLTILYYPKADGFVRQGITTFVGGQCGNSPAPVGNYVGNPWMLSELHQEVSPTMYDADWLHPREEVNKLHKEKFGWEIDWNTMGEFFNKLEGKGFSPNYVPMVGHGEIRSVVLGPDYRRESTKKEIEQMVKITEEAMIDGCIGLTVGRDYDPGIWANFEEIFECAKIVAKYDGVYAAHSLRTSHRKARRPGEASIPATKGVLETIDIGRKAKASVQISHLGNLYSVNPGDSKILTEAGIKATLKLVNDANHEGLDISFDVIPNSASGGIGGNHYLAARLRPWLKIAGSLEQFAKALRMPDWREEIKNSVMSGKYYGLNPNITPTWAEGGILIEHSDSRFKNKTISQIAKEMNIDELEALMQAIIADPNSKIFRKPRDDSSLLTFMKHPKMMVGIDTFAVDETRIGSGPAPGLPSENSFGGFPHYIKRAVRETNTLTLEEAIMKITYNPACKFKIPKRGIIKPGYFADLTIFNLETINDKGDQMEPRLYPEGIEYVIINGVLVVNENKHTGKTPGKILRRE
ncbi:amidohydrolase family protein [Candidatus Bathyarchaeota archaeon]|nr:amidohydrolase family protein [Candidatus Bathyarchaeota archaeon]